VAPVFEQDASRPPPGLRPHIVARLRPGWRYDARRRGMISPAGETLTLPGELPRGSRVQYMVPELAEKPPEELTEDERTLGRYVHVILPAGTDPASHVATVAAWPCIEEAHLPPDISLPS
jgi:hypothetical protein